ADRAAEARRRDGRRHARIPERARVPARPPARAAPRRAAAVHADDRGARRARHRLVARRAGGEDRLLERVQADRRVVVRAAALLGLLACLVGWYELAPPVGALSLWPSIWFIALVLIPLNFLLVWLALPLWNNRLLGPFALALVGLALVFSNLDVP